MNPLHEITAWVNAALNVVADEVWCEVGIRDEGCNG